MENALKIWKANRKNYSDFLAKYSLDQLNKIPNGFNNNLIWNIGHIIVTQQSLVYKLSNLQMHISEDLFNHYKSGTKPTAIISQEEVDELKYLLTWLIEKTEIDVAGGRFVTFNERTTGTGFHIYNLETAVEFNNYHEALHMGFMMSIRKFV